MNYAGVLKELIDISNLTAKYIANYIGYDNSYISKWTTGKNIPSPKMHYYINTKLADLFSKSIITKKALDDLSTLFERKVLLISKELVRYYILCLLQDAYFVSASNFDLPELEIKDRDVFIDREEIIEAIRIIGNQILANSKNDIRVITTNSLEFVVNIQYDLFDVFYVTRDIPVRFLYFLDDVEKNKFIQSFEESLFMTLQFGFYDVEFVLVPQKPEHSLILIENEVALIFEYYNKSTPKIMTSTTDLRVLETYYAYYTNVAKRSRTILRSSNNIKTEYDTLRNMILPDNEVLIYLSFYSGLFMPRDLIESLAHKHKISDELKSTLFDFRQLYSILLKNTKVKMIFSEEVLHNSILTRSINFCEKQITLTHEETEKYINHVKKVINDLENVEFYSYTHSKKGPVIKFSDYKITFVADKSNTLISRDFSMVNSNSMRYIAFDYPELSTHFYNFITEKYLGNYYTKIEKDDIFNLIERSLLFVE